jgi:hypothetical protein
MTVVVPSSVQRHSQTETMTLARLLLSCALLAGLSGCGVLAAPCRLASTVIKMVPVVGHAAAAPTDACAAVLDP